MDEKKNNLLKIIRYRLSYTGTKETDILYKKLIMNKLKRLNYSELQLLSLLLIDISDIELFNIFTNKQKKPTKYKNLITKLLNE